MGNESEGENICESLDQGSANSDQLQLTWEVISSDGSNSEIDIDDLEQTDSASYQLSALAIAQMIQVLQHKRSDGLTLNTLKIALTAKDRTKRKHVEFFLELRGRLQV